MRFIRKIIEACLRGKEKPNRQRETVIALAGNPNVGKSTVFNRLTGLHQHTGNWAGKTVATAEGCFLWEGRKFRVVDIPGMYSFAPHSAEEEAAAAFLCSGRADATVVVCDAGCLRRGIAFVLETAELTGNIIVCVNLMDEAERRGVRVDTEKLSRLLGMPVVAVSAARGKGIDRLTECIGKQRGGAASHTGKYSRVRYAPPIEEKIQRMEKAISTGTDGKSVGSHPRFQAVRLLLGDGSGNASEQLLETAEQCRAELEAIGLDREKTAAAIASRRILTADAICEQCVSTNGAVSRRTLDRRLDRLFTGRVSGRVCMLLLLCLVFWLTITGANAPSEWLSGMFGRLEPVLHGWLESRGVPVFLKNLLIEGIYRILTRIISVMLPPMAIFFPLFTLLEDAGYLPRAAFNLDNSLRRCGACGKQALTSCMGFGCNAVGVTGCRIIDSPRERLMAILTNSFIPCNGRFPMLTALIALFLPGSIAPPFDSVVGALMLTGLICLGLTTSFAVSKLLSLTLLRGAPSSFALELPPYRKPRFGSVILRSALDRTLFVLGRAAAVAVPAGALIWLAANVSVGGETVLRSVCDLLDPLGQFLGMDGVILTAFLLGLPANEIVIPLMLMAYTAQGSMTGTDAPASVHALLTANGWTAGTAVCVMLFTLMHWPCATTCLTVYKETGSFKWTALAILIPTLTGFAVCAAVAAVWRMGFL